MYYDRLGLMYIQGTPTTAFTPLKFDGYDASIFNLVLLPDSQAGYDRLISNGFQARNILYNPTEAQSLYVQPTRYINSFAQVATYNADDTFIYPINQLPEYSYTPNKPFEYSIRTSDADATRIVIYNNPDML